MYLRNLNNLSCEKLSLFVSPIPSSLQFLNSFTHILSNSLFKSDRHVI